MEIKNHILPCIILSQFLCTSLWFAGNGIMDDLISYFDLNPSALAYLTSSVQFGFISGTLVFALLSIADRYSPSKVFLTCALLGSSANLLIIVDYNSFMSLILLRFITGFFLAGIYPVGMKIAADYFEKGLGLSLSLLVGALVLGTGLPHLLKDIFAQGQWRNILLFTSGCASLGGIIMYLTVPDGPYRKAQGEIQLSAFLKVFQKKSFRLPAFAYFGHMWELYTFWAFIPYILTQYQSSNPEFELNTPFLSFAIIASGALSCAFGGILSSKWGNKKIAGLALIISTLCCLLFPLSFTQLTPFLFLVYLFIWGMAVIADSPQLSTLVAQNAPLELKGTALTIVNCIGFSITILSIQLMSYLSLNNSIKYIFMILSIGPAVGLIALIRNR